MTEPTKPDEKSMEFSDPYTIHPSDHTGLILVSKTLDGNNYGQWSRAMCMGLSAKNKIGFIDGTIKAPSLLDAKYVAWKRCNDMVTLWIANSVHSEIASSIMYTENAAAVWNDLKDRFSQSSDSRIYQIRQEIVESCQGQLSVSAYYTKMKALWDESTSKDLLNGKRKKGKPFNTLSCKSLKCTYCDGGGHSVDRCYYIIGFPVGHKWHGKNVKPKNKISEANNAEAINSATTNKLEPNASNGPMFTTEEYNQIIAMLRNGNGQPLANATGHGHEEGDWPGQTF
ncbi:unnamed protein product [Malus baccata var. baccata]